MKDTTAHFAYESKSHLSVGHSILHALPDVVRGVEQIGEQNLALGGWSRWVEETVETLLPGRQIGSVPTSKSIAILIVEQGVLVKAVGKGREGVFGGRRCGLSVDSRGRMQSGCGPEGSTPLERCGQRRNIGISLV